MTGVPTAGPLAGLRVLVTRPAGTGADLLAALRRAGAHPCHVPLIEIRTEESSPAMSRAAAALAAGEFDWVAFTSAAAVAAVRAAAERGRHPWIVRTGTRVAAVGSATARALADAGIRADLVPTEGGSAAELAAALSAARDPDRPGGSVLLPRSDLARPDLPDALRAAGYRVETVVAYRTVTLPVPDRTAQALAGGTIDAVVLTSPSTARALGHCAPAGTIVVAIGRSTARAAAAAGIPVTAVATEPDAAALVRALIGAAAGRRATM